MTDPLDPDQTPEPEEITEEDYHLSDEESESFKALISIGALSESIDVFGHEVIIRTLSAAEELEVGMLLKPYLETTAFQRALRTYIVAAAVRVIDDRPLIQKLNPFDQDENSVKLKYEKMKDYYPPVIDVIYERYTKLEQKLYPVLSRLGKTSS